MSSCSLVSDGCVRDRLRACEAVYVNSLDQLQLLWDAGLPRTAAVRTASPGLARLLDFPVDRLGSELSSDFILQLLETFDRLSLAVYRRLGEANSKELALAVSKAVWGGQRIVYDALLMRREDEDRPVCIPVLTGTTAALTNVLRFGWSELRRGDPDVVAPEILVDAARFSYVSPPTAGVWRRLRLAVFGQLAFRIQIAAAERLSFLPWRGTLFCHRDPELLKDAGLSLLLRRIQLKPIRPPVLPDGPAADGETTNAIAGEVEPLLRSHLSRHLDDRNLKRCLAIIRHTVDDAAGRFFAARHAAGNMLADGLPIRSGLASSTIGTSEAIALAEGFRKHGKPVFTFSHGATRRISQHHDRNPILHETIISDVHFDFAREEAECDAGGAEHVVAGVPAFYRRKPFLSRLRRSEGIWYVSSGLYMGGADKLHRAMSDHDQCDFEARIVSEVLARVPHPVVYKPYPALRYPDPDPVLVAAREAGLSVHESGTDLRYEIHKPELLIVSRSGSTIGYCLCQDKPLVYIEAPGRKLREQVADDFDRGIFLFSAYDPGFTDKLADFLSLPMAEIRARWTGKKAARERLIRRHIHEPVENGAEMIATRIERALDSRAGCNAVT